MPIRPIWHAGREYGWLTACCPACSSRTALSSASCIPGRDWDGALGAFQGQLVHKVSRESRPEVARPPDLRRQHATARTMAGRLQWHHVL